MPFVVQEPQKKDQTPVKGCRASQAKSCCASPPHHPARPRVQRRNFVLAPSQELQADTGQEERVHGSTTLGLFLGSKCVNTASASESPSDEEPINTRGLAIFAHPPRLTTTILIRVKLRRAENRYINLAFRRNQSWCHALSRELRIRT